VDRELKNNAFENQVKPFYTKPEVLRARAVFKYFGNFQLTLFVHPAYVRCVYICVTVLMKQLLVYSAKNTITKSNPASPIYLELFHTFKCILLAIQYSQNHSKKNKIKNNATDVLNVS
jgi:hypothetical protein